MNIERLKSVPLKNIKIDDLYWSKYINTIFENGIMYQWDIINDRIKGAEKSYSISNFMIAAKRKTGKFGGKVFQDTDTAKWLEAVAYSLEIKENKELEALADWTIDLIGDAQCSDGYINTYYTIEEPGKRWTNLVEGHELYTAGHLIEAAVAYYNSTGKDKFLKIMCRFADLIHDTFGEEEGKIKAYPGHPEIELALVKLYYTTGEKKYLETAKFFVDKRGTKPDYFSEEIKKRNYKFIFPELEGFDSSYYLNHKPVREQNTADGHAVRNVYLYSAVADIAYEYKDDGLMDTCRRVFNNIATKRMFITGSIGSSAIGERFTCDYDLPNNSNYSESCASVGLAFFAKRMLEIDRDSKYADILERALYNTVLSGISLKGDKFFYVNPLEVIPDVCEQNTSLSHVKAERQKWFGVACCPPNIVRTLASLGQYIYSTGEEELFVNLFISNESNISVKQRNVKVEINTKYPFKSSIDIKLNTEESTEFTLAVRIPQWCSLKSIELNRRKDFNYSIDKGYIKIKRTWNRSELLCIEYDMPAQFVYSNPKVRSDVGKVAVVKGPVVYCLEEADNGKNLGAIAVDCSAKLVERYEEELLSGTLTISASAERINDSGWENVLYSTKKPQTEQTKVRFIPYCLWNNRGKGEMLVWVRYKD
ncbi:glycoside hydrolase family 127 protein [Clostridium oryzae]|uniref:Non-reducing end beta-L-arabinofuranosidase n=1 Tax=Clostridium oryzae TaxID=1450648 RepID=A0A1V4IQS3_9CLOT|nr:beta-L-arabinofuranosidase domain-containing protein [Clostridium oryzae]OPJ62154.1 Non-reducing end beta-L-arabinofuranosidase [Clostridium oryzae]